jgi:hypothetical protein
MLISSNLVITQLQTMSSDSVSDLPTCTDCIDKL